MKRALLFLAVAAVVALVIVAAVVVVAPDVGAGIFPEG